MYQSEVQFNLGAEFQPSFDWIMFWNKTTRMLRRLCETGSQIKQYYPLNLNSIGIRAHDMDGQEGGHPSAFGRPPSSCFDSRIFEHCNSTIMAKIDIFTFEVPLNFELSNLKISPQKQCKGILLEWDIIDLFTDPLALRTLITILVITNGCVLMRNVIQPGCKNWTMID